MKLQARRIVTAAAALLCIASAGVVAEAASPVANESFAITLPDGFGEFTSQSQKTKAADGEIETTNWVSKAPTGEAVVVTVSRMPGRILDPQKLMASTRDTLLASLKAQVEKEEKVEGDLPAMDILFRGQTENPPYLRSKLAVSEDRFYQVLYVGRSEEQRANASVAALFDSFHIGAAGTPAATPAAAPASE